MKFGFKGIHHIAISVSSMIEAKKFYVDTLGFAIIDSEHYPPSEEMDVVMALQGAECDMLMVNAGNVILEIFEFQSPAQSDQTSPRPLSDHGYTHLAFEVEDIQLAYEYLGDAGVRWHHSPAEAGEGYMMAYGRDPFGNVIEVQQLAGGFPHSFDQLSLPQ
jgi:catechol 2,3-dioxygenase-like lactoylglutathione lyase family enzyme